MIIYNINIHHMYTDLQLLLSLYVHTACDILTFLQPI